MRYCIDLRVAEICVADSLSMNACYSQACKRLRHAVISDDSAWELLCREVWGIAEVNAGDVPCLDSILMRSPEAAGDALSSGSGSGSGSGSLTSLLTGGGADTVCSRAMLASLVATTSGGRVWMNKALPSSPLPKAYGPDKGGSGAVGEKQASIKASSHGHSSNETSKTSSPWREIYRDRIQVID